MTTLSIPSERVARKATRLSDDLIRQVIAALITEFNRPGATPFARRAALREWRAWRLLLGQIGRRR
jgi:hypothetical protein